MKNILAASTALAAALALSPAAQAEGLYGSFFGGVNLLGEVESEEFLGYSVDTEFDTGFVVGGTIGYELDPSIRVEGEFAFRSNDVDQATFNTPFGSTTYDVEGEAEILSLMANAWYDFDLGSGFQPFVGGGLGMAKVEVDSEDDTVFAFQAGAGVSYPLSGGIEITGEYRFFKVTDPTFIGIDYEIPGQHAFIVGARVPF